MTAALPIALCLAPVVACADVGDYLGTWCPQGPGPLMHVDDQGIGLGDHTMCDWKTAPRATAESLTGVLTCRNIYVTGEHADGTLATVETEHRRGVAFQGFVTRTDRFGGRYLEASLDGAIIEAEFGPCG